MFVCSTRKQLLEYLENRLTYNHQILWGHPHRHCRQLYLIWRQYLLPVGFGWNFLRTVPARIITFYTLIEDKRPHKPAGNVITRSFRSAAKMLLNTTESAQNVTEMQKRAHTSEMVRDTAKETCTAASKASPNFSREEYRQSFAAQRSDSF